MSVWLTIPSARSDAGTVPMWKARGYRIALWRDREDGIRERFSAEGLVIVGAYPGYAKAVNSLVKAVLQLDPESTWCVAGGDDTEPDLNHAPEQIARECSEHFCTLIDPRLYDMDCVKPGTFGIMQPTGDRWANGSIDRICGSPWMGREFCQRMYGGSGPFFEGYSHMFVDQELQEVASGLGVLWQRRDLIHLHNHFLRTNAARDVDRSAPPPPHLVKWNTQEHWDESRALFESRRVEGFPGYQPLEVRA
jgi:hypothetical protein